MKRFSSVVWAVAVVSAGGCTALLGVDHEYRLGSTTTQGGGGAGGSTAATTTVGTGGEGGGPGTTGTSTGTSTGTGGSVCVGKTGTGVVADCDNLNITPPSHGGGASATCGAGLNEEPPGYGLCTHGFAVFNTGAASTLVACLATIGVQDRCKIEPLKACIDKMYDAQCESSSIKSWCGGIAHWCKDDPIEVVQCSMELNPVRDEGLSAVATCMENSMLKCQQSFDACRTEVLGF